MHLIKSSKNLFVVIYECSPIFKGSFELVMLDKILTGKFSLFFSIQLLPWLFILFSFI